MQEEEEEAPPVYPNYSITKSSGDSVASGDDSVQWEEEAERVLAAHYDRAAEEEARSDSVPNDIPEIEEFMLLGMADKTIGEENGLVQYENVVYSFRTTTAKKLVEIAKELGMQYTDKQNTVRCLTCNVNLCPNCWNEWHWVDMRDTNRLLGR